MRWCDVMCVLSVRTCSARLNNVSWQATSVTLFLLYGKRLNRSVNNPDLYVYTVGSNALGDTVVLASRHMLYDVIDNMVRVSLPGNFL